jgi:hypothetical protein
MKRCNNCFWQYEGFTDLSDGKSTETPGAINICANCGQVCQFGSDLQLTPMTPDQILELVDDHPQTYTAILHAVGVIMKRIELN